ncbi:MAG: hypothetical protein ACFFCK_07240 [Promethearchaeota archaeon]
MQTKKQFTLALLIAISASLLLVPVIVAETTQVERDSVPVRNHEIISLREEVGPRIRTNETTTTVTPPPELNPISVGLIGCIDMGLTIALVFFIVKRK